MSLNQSFEDIQLMEESFEEEKYPSPDHVQQDQKKTQSPQTLSLPIGFPKEVLKGMMPAHQEIIQNEVKEAKRSEEIQHEKKGQTSSEHQMEQSEEILINDVPLDSQESKATKGDQPNQLECTVSYVFPNLDAQGKLLKQQFSGKKEKKERDIESEKSLSSKQKSNESLEKKRKQFTIACQRHYKKKMQLKKEQIKQQVHHRSSEKGSSELEKEPIVNPYFDEFQPNIQKKEYLVSKREDFTIACQRFRQKKVSLKKDVIDQEVQKKYEQPNFNPSFQEYFSQCKLISNSLKCSGGFQAIMVCIEKKCSESAYICASQSCASCKKRHQNCVLKLTTEMLTLSLNKNLERQKPIAQQIFEIQEEMLKQVYKSRANLMQFMCLQGADSKMLSQILEKSQEKNQIELCSSYVLELFQSFIKEETKDKYRLNAIKGKIKGDKQVIKSILENQVKAALEPLNFYDISHLSSNLVCSKPQVKFVLKTLNFPKDIKLIYRASQHNFNLEKYHKLCDDLQNVLTIIKTQHEKIIGAFTPLKLKNNVFGKDRQNKTFLMAINLKEKLEHTRNGQCAIHYEQEKGPCFGGLFEQRDLEVFKENGLLYCTTSFPCNFNWKKQFESCQESWRFLTGVKEGKKCQVMDFEVFQIIPRD